MMIGEILSQHSWLWPLAWQSTAALAVGLGGSFILRHRPVHAHQVLLLALATAVLLPAMSIVVNQHQWGLLAATPATIRLESRPLVMAEPPSAPKPAARTEMADVRSAATPVPGASAARIRQEVSPIYVLYALWVAASATLLMRLSVRFLLGLRLARQSEPVTSDPINSAIESAKLKLQIETNVLVRGGRQAHSPVIWCWGKEPVLLVPDNQHCSDSIDWESVVCPGTLLNLTPQGHAALVPAVVPNKKGLAGRVRASSPTNAPVPMATSAGPWRQRLLPRVWPSAPLSRRPGLHNRQTWSRPSSVTAP